MVGRRRAGRRDQNRPPSIAARVAFAVGFVSLIGSFYAAAGLTVWSVWRAFVALAG
jgi:hypothetical protein